VDLNRRFPVRGFLFLAAMLLLSWGRVVAFAEEKAPAFTGNALLDG